ncbi:MAG: type III-A CRISPR-associated RAMP protein Csm3 [SAR324 cluster bacterium]|nr:type III-A CRISPR-associated RAMP protein Csm3 [SAR324 cluster bacterium]
MFIRGTIEAVTGLHIGGSSMGLAIGGADSIVVRNPITAQPYIPGSSLKGKMRSLYELLNGLTDGKPCFNTKEPVARLFGVAVDKQDGEPVPCRLIVRDAHLSSTSEERLLNAVHTDMLYTEVKTEVVLDRFTAKAMPRQIERVPAGSFFDFEIVITLYNIDEAQKVGGQKSYKDLYLDVLKQCMMILQEDYIGGSGSRGYGQIRFHLTEISEKTVEDYEKLNKAKFREDTLTDFKKVLTV